MRLLLLALLAAPLAAQAQTVPCADHAALTRALAEGWGETRRSLALDSTGALLETWANLETGTWTITTTRPGGPTCIVASGWAWQTLAETEVEGSPKKE